MNNRVRLGVVVLVLATCQTGLAQRQMEKLGRGVVAVNQGEGSAFVSWRMLGTEPDSISFNVYRTTGAGQPVRLNSQPITNRTWFQDASADVLLENAYTVRTVVNGSELPDNAAFLNRIPARSIPRPYFSIPLEAPAAGTTLDGVSYTYRANDCSAADLDGDGEYEIILKWDPSNSKDNSETGYTGNVFLDAYKLDGKRLWRIDLGRNIRAGAHYTQFMVYDLDGDGKAEMMCKTADGTTDSAGTVIGDRNVDHRNDRGFILTGPEFLTLFDGLSGKIVTTIPYPPPREAFAAPGRPASGNQPDRFLAAIAYLDGSRPSAVFCRGYYGKTVLVALDYRDGKLIQRWTFDSDTLDPAAGRYGGQGNHGLVVADVDADGKDEIIYGACTIDDNGKGLHTTGLGHGDAMHVSDLDPNRPGLEIFAIHENARHPNPAELRDARTGEMLWGKPGAAVLGADARGPDVGRGNAMDIDPRHPGYEMWTRELPELWNAKGEVIAATKPPACNFGIWWDGDLLREIEDLNRIEKWNWKTSTATPLLVAEGCLSNNGSKATPGLVADLFGDWREEVIWRTADNTELRIYTTTIPTPHRMYTLMHDPQYRLSIAWQNVAYNQPPHPGFFLGEGMTQVARPPIRVVP